MRGISGADFYSWIATYGGRVWALICACVAMTAFTLECAAAPAPISIKPAGVYVVGALHSLHEHQQSFDYKTLRRVIEAIDPDVLVLEVRPDELKDFKETPGRPEYPRAIWPLLRNTPIKSVAMEPGGAEFETLVEQVSRAFDAFEHRDPRQFEWWSSYQSSLSSVLQRYWRKPADTQDRVTEDLARSYYLTQYGVVGSELRNVQERWDGYMVALARETVRANSGKKVLILGSYRNRHRFVDAIREDAPDRLVDMQKWLSEMENRL